MISFHAYSEKMSNFVKKVLVAKGELERLQQAQLREYSSPVSHMGDLNTMITQVLGDKHMSAEVKRKLLATYQSQFEKLQRDTGLLSGSTPAAGSKEVKMLKKKQLRLTPYKPRTSRTKEKLLIQMTRRRLKTLMK